LSAGFDDERRAAYVFDVGAWMNSDDVSVFDAKIVTNNTVYPSASIIELIVSQDDEDGILSLLSLDQDSVSSKQLQSFHGLVGESDDRVVVIFGIGNAKQVSSSSRVE
jgi:hypothetical protein